MKRKIHTSKVLLIGILLATAGLAGCADSDSDDDFDFSGGGGGNPPAGDSSCQIDGTALCAIPTIGEAIVSGAGGSCPDNAGQLTPLQLCAVPGVGQPLAEAICGVSCPVGDPGEEPPLSLEQLCAIPTLGPQIVEGAGGTCPPTGGGGGSTGTLLHDGSAVGPVVDPLDEAVVTPASDAGLSVLLEPVADNVANPLLDALGAGGGGGGAPSPEQLCAIPAPIGPALAGAAGATCPGGGGGDGAPGLPASPVSGQCLPGDPTGMLCAP